MKQLFKVVTLSLCTMAMTAGAYAADKPADTAGLKVATFSGPVLMQKAPQVAEMNKTLEKEFKPREQKIADLQKAIKQEREKLDRDGSVMNDTDRTQLQNKIVADTANMQSMIAAYRQDLSNTQGKAMQEFNAKVIAVISQIAKERKYDLVLQAESAAYVNPNLDITDAVLSGLKK